MKLKTLALALSVSLFVYNCSSDSKEELEENATEQETNNDTDDTTEDNDTTTNDDTTARVTYNNTVRDIMANNCTRCHGSPTTNGAPFPLLNFDQVSSRSARIISRMNNQAAPMPPRGLVSASIRAQMDQWRADGLLEN